MTRHRIRAVCDKGEDWDGVSLHGAAEGSGHQGPSRETGIFRAVPPARPSTLPWHHETAKDPALLRMHLLRLWPPPSQGSPLSSPTASTAPKPPELSLPNPTRLPGAPLGSLPLGSCPCPAPNREASVGGRLTSSSSPLRCRPQGGAPVL